MSTAAIIAVTAAVVVIAAVAAALVLQGGAGPGIKRRFGPEYERALALHDGDARATRRELAERFKRYRGLEPRALAPDTRQRYAARWTALQGQFVDDPAAALGSADTLIAELAVDRGYPAADSPEHVDALSVHHPRHVQGYRDAHAAALAAGSGQSGPGLDTEAQRKALVAARGLFEELLRSGASDGPGAAAPESPETPQAAPETRPKEGAGSPKAAIGKRIAALTARGRTEAHQ